MSALARAELVRQLAATLPAAEAEAAFGRALAALALPDKPRYSVDEALAVARALMEEGFRQVAAREAEVQAADFPDLTDPEEAPDDR